MPATLDELFDEHKIPHIYRRGIRQGVEDLDFTVAGFVVWTQEHKRNFKKMERTFKDIDEWMENCASGQCGPIIPNGVSGNIEAVWCFEELADAMMFKLQFCSL